MKWKTRSKRAAIFFYQPRLLPSRLLSVTAAPTTASPTCHFAYRPTLKSEKRKTTSCGWNAAAIVAMPSAKRETKNSAPDA